MRRLSPRFFRCDITLYTSIIGRDAAGGTTRNPSAGSPFLASVQGNSASWRPILGALYAETSHVVLFRSFPVDTSAGARAALPTQRLGPEVNTQDILDWASFPGVSPPIVHLQALGPAIDQGGHGVGWVVACKAIT
jgi:hypothetical protein